MSEFSNSVSKMLEYEKLAKCISTQMIKDNMFIDLGAGDCRLIAIMNDTYGIKSVGIDLDKEKVLSGIDNGFNVILGDIRKLPTIKEFAENSLTLHAGFCLFNIFPLSEVLSIIRSYFNIKEVKEIFFEIQNKQYFEEKYPAGEKFTHLIKDMSVTSWNERFEISNEEGVDLVMEYYSSKGEFINRTEDRLFTHDYDDVLSGLNNLEFSTLTEHQWPIRFGVENEESHHYIHLKRS